MNYHESNHGRQKMAGKPQNENLPKSRKPRSAKRAQRTQDFKTTALRKRASKTHGSASGRSPVQNGVDGGVEPELIGRKEVARRLSKSLRTICYWMADGCLPFHKVRGSIIFDWNQVKAAVLKEQ